MLSHNLSQTWRQMSPLSSTRGVPKRFNPAPPPFPRAPRDTHTYPYPYPYLAPARAHLEVRGTTRAHMSFLVVFPPSHLPLGVGPVSAVVSTPCALSYSLAEDGVTGVMCCDSEGLLLMCEYRRHACRRWAHCQCQPHDAFNVRAQGCTLSCHEPMTRAPPPPPPQYVPHGLDLVPDSDHEARLCG